MVNKRSDRSERRSLLPVGALVVAAILVAGAACSEDTAPPEPTYSLRVGMLPTTDYLPVFAMIEEGFAAREGLTITESTVVGGTAILAGLVDGSLDIGNVGIPSLAAGAEAGTVPAKAVGVVAGTVVSPDHPLIGVVAADGVSDFAALSGRLVAVNSKVSLGAAAIIRRVTSTGAPPPELVEIPFTNMGLALRSGDVAAAVTLDPYLTQSIGRGDGHLLGWVVGGPPMERVQAGIYSAGADVVRTKPDALKAFIRALLASQEWVRTHPKESRQLLAKRLAIAPDVVAKITLPAFRRDGRSNAQQIQVILDLLAPPGAEPAPADSLFDETLLAAARADA